MNKAVGHPDFLKVLFFLLVALGHAISSLARPLRHLRLLWRYPPWDFFLHPGACYAGCFGDCSALSRTFEGSTWSKSIVSQTSHWSWSGSGLHSRFITAEESSFQTVLLLLFFPQTWKNFCHQLFVMGGWLTQISAMLRKEGPSTD